MMNHNTHWTIIPMLLLSSLLAACSEDEQTSSPPEPTIESPQPTATQQDTDAETDPLNVGAIFKAPGFEAKYLGLAKIDRQEHADWQDGYCYVFLAEVTRTEDHLNLGDRLAYQPATKGLLANGERAEPEKVNINCEVEPLLELGYQPKSKARLRVGETARTWMQPFHVPEGTELQSIEIGISYSFLPVITEDTTQ